MRKTTRCLSLCEIERSSNEPVVVRGNTQILSEMVRNLVENAIRYNVEGGRAQVAVSRSG